MSSAPRRLTDRIIRHSGLLTIVFLVLLVGYHAITLSIVAMNGHPMSTIDEHVHFDTALKMHEWQIPFRGALYGDGLLQEWACGVGHDGGTLAHACGDPALSISDLPSGIYTTGYIHYPTYFFLAELFRRGVESLFGPQTPIDIYRLFSAVVMVLGTIVTGVFAYLFGLRRSALIAAVTIPVAASLTLVMGIMVTPNSMSILCGALIAGAGIAWIRRGKGFGWLIAATVFGSLTAVIASLPAGAFILAGAVAVLLKRRGRVLPGRWNPKMWHVLALGAAVLLPVILWGRYISASATISDAQLYAAFPISDWTAIASGAVQEFLSLHTPWTESGAVLPVLDWRIGSSLRQAVVGIPFWINILVIGVVVLAAIGVVLTDRRRRVNTLIRPRPIRSSVDMARVLATTTIATIVLYPAALRISNSLSFSIDHPIVSRYSMAFAPLLILLALLITRRRAYSWILAGMGTLSMLALTGGWR